MVLTSKTPFLLLTFLRNDNEEPSEQAANGEEEDEADGESQMDAVLCFISLGD